MDREKETGISCSPHKVFFLLHTTNTIVRT